jgi:hypothetical protein
MHYWLIDYNRKLSTDNKKCCHFKYGFIKVNADKTAEATMHADADKPALIKQVIKYTTFPLNEINYG